MKKKCKEKKKCIGREMELPKEIKNLLQRPPNEETTKKIIQHKKNQKKHPRIYVD